jgi:hypothetical protein
MILPFHPPEADDSNMVFWKIFKVPEPTMPDVAASLVQ